MNFIHNKIHNKLHQEAEAIRRQAPKKTLDKVVVTLGLIAMLLILLSGTSEDIKTENTLKQKEYLLAQTGR